MFFKICQKGLFLILNFIHILSGHCPLFATVTPFRNTFLASLGVAKRGTSGVIPEWRFINWDVFLWIVDHVCLFIELCGLKPNIYNKSTKESAVGCPTRSAYAQHKRYDSSVWLMCHTFWRRIMPTRVEERDSHVAKRHKINRVVRHAETTYTIALDDTIAKGMTHGCMTHSGDSSQGWIITERNTFNFLLLQFRSDQWSSSIGRRTPFRNPSLPDKSRVLCHFCSLIFV